MLKAGRTALAKNDCETAIEKFRKALAEFPDLIESMYWLGAAFEKKSDKAEALKSYRDYVRMFEDKKKNGEVSKEEIRLQGLASKRVDVLGVGEREFKKLETSFVEKLFQYARDNFVRDPALSLQALQILLDIAPDHTAAQRLFEKLGGKIEAPPAVESGAKSGVGPFRDVKNWNDMIEEKIFGSPPGWSYEQGKILVDMKDCGITFAKAMYSTGPNYAFELESKCLQEYERGWLMGLVFGERKGEFAAVLFQKTQICFFEETPTGKIEPEPILMPPIALDTWHRIGVIVKGPKVQIWFNGKKIRDYTFTSRPTYEGMVGIFHQRCKAEYRLVRIGKLD